MAVTKYDHQGLAEKCIRICILNEGGDKVTNRKNDKGGITKFGISDTSDGVKDGLVILADGTKKKVQDLTEADAIGIYSKRYYKPIHAEYLKDEELILNIFDFGVTSGPQTAISKLQEILHVQADGDMGPITSDKANNFQGDLIAAFKTARKSFYNRVADKDVAVYKLKHPDATFSDLLKYTDEGNRKGWINRVNNLKLK